MPIQGNFKPMQLIMTMNIGDRGFIPASKITVTEKFFRVPIETPVAEVCDDYFKIGIEKIGSGITSKDYNLIFEDNLDQNARCEMFTLYDYAWTKNKEQEVSEEREVPNYKACYLNFRHTIEDIRTFLEKTFTISVKTMSIEELQGLKRQHEQDEFYDLMQFIDNELSART